MRAELPIYQPKTLGRLASCTIVAWWFAMLMMPDATGQGRTDIVVGIDHVPIAVANLDSAAAHFVRLGFALKPGRPHENGIRNQHVKFPDGTELELIAAPEAVDDLTREYRAFLEHGDGPAFVALYAPDKQRLSQALDAAPLSHDVGWGVTFAQDHPLRYLFFGPRNASPTDKPEHFRHTNGAQSLIGVWLATDIRDHELTLLAAINAEPAATSIMIPDSALSRTVSVGAEIVAFAEGSLTFLPRAMRRIKNRPIVGVTLRTDDLEKTRRVLGDAGLGERIMTSRGGSWQSVFVQPMDAHGLWIEFRQES